MSTQQDAIKRLYPVASKFYKIDTEEEFREKMQDQQKRKKLYDGLLGRGLTTEQLGDYDKFDAYITQSFNNPANVPIQEPQRPGITDAQSYAQQAPPTATGKKAQDILRTGIAQGLKQHNEKQDALLQTKEEGLRLQQMYDLFSKENEDAIFLAKTKRATASVPGMVMPASAYTEQEADVIKQRNTLQSALELNKKTQKILAAPSRFDDSNAFANFGKGAASKATDIDFWTFGITNIAKNLNTREVAKKLQDAQDQYGEDIDIDTILTEPEKALLNAFYANLNASALRADDLSIGYQAGQGAMDSAKFMAEFILTGGISKAATKGATKALETWLVKNMTSKAGKLIGKGIAATSRGLMQTAIRTPIMLSTYSNISDQLVLFDENGRLKNGFEAIGIGFLDSFIENLSETQGENIIAGLKLPFRGLISKIPETGFTKFFQNLSKTGAYKLMKQGGWNGFAGEYFEEWYGNSLRALTGNKEALQDFATVEQQLITLASFAPITVLGGAVSTAQYASAEKNFQNATLALKDILKDNGYKASQAEYIMDLIMDTTPSQMAKKVAPVVNQMALEETGDAGNVMTALSEFIRTKSIMQGYDGIYQAEHQEKRQELDQDMQNEIGEYTNKKGEVEMAVDQDGNANYVLSDVADELEPLIVIKGLDGQTKMVSKSEYEANYTPSVLTSKDEYLSQMIMTKQEAELAEEIKIEEDANFLNSIELGVPQYFNIDGVMTEGTPQAITPDGSITVHFGNHVEMLTADQYKALNQPTAVTATQTEDLAKAEQERKEVEEQKERAQEQAQPVQGEQQPLAPEEAAQGQSAPQEAAKELPKTEDGETDFDALLDADPETYAQELSRAIGEERAANTMSALAKQTDAQIEKLQKRLEKETSTNKIVSINRNIDQLQQRRDALTGLIIKGSKPQTPQTPEVTGAQTTKTAQPVQAGEIGQNIVEKWDNAPKDYGIEETFTLPNGKEIKGRWVLSEAGAATPSHDPHTLQQSEGFPVTKDGKTANSNDYTKKLDMVELVSADYDRRAIDNPVYVKRGAVLSGNNRTISGILAAERGTDKKYIQALTDKARKLGFTPEQISKYKHPRVVIEVTDDLPITTETFAMFNRDDKKQQSPTELAVVASKMDNTRTIGLISRELDGYERLSDLYQNPGASATIAKYLVEGGLITQFELSPLFANNSFTSGGKDFLESVLVGSVLREDQINILDTEGMKSTRQRVVKAIVPLIENSKLREEGRIIDDINTGIMYLYGAKKAGMTLREYFLQSNMFEAATYDLNGVQNAMELQRTEKEFRDYVQLANKRLKDPIANMFTGEIESKDDLYKELENQYNDEQRRTIEAARAANVQSGAAGNEQGTVLPGAQEGNEPGGSGISADAGEQTEAASTANEGSGTEIGQQAEQPKTDLGITSVFGAAEKVAKNSQGEIAPQSEAGIPASEESHTQEEKKEEPGIVSVFKAAQEQKEKNEVQNKQDGKTIIPQKISKPKMPKTKEEYCRTLANIVSNYPPRHVTTGVLFDADNKMIVATDAFKLIAIPSSLPKTTEIIGASKRKSSEVVFGELLKGQYPNYKAVIPLSSSERFEGRFNIELLLGQALTMLKEANERIKQLDNLSDKEKSYERLLKFGVHNVNAKQLSDVLRALYDTGTKHVIVEYSRRDAPIVFRDERNMNKVGLVMPVYIPEEGEDNFEERFRNIPVLVNRNTIAINKEPGNKEEKKESEKEDSAMNTDNSPVAEEEDKTDKQAPAEKIDNIFASLSDLAPHNGQLWAKTSVSRWQANKYLKDIREFQDAAIESGAIEYKEHLDRHNYEMIEGKEIKINTYKLNGYTIEVGYDGGFSTHGASGFYTQVENPQGEVLKIYDPKYRTEKTYDISYQHPRFREKLEKSAEVIDPSIKPKKGDKIAFEIGGREVKFEYDSFISDKNGTLTYDYFGMKTLKPGEYRIERGGNVINVKQGNGSNTKLASTEEREVLEKIEDFGEKIEGAKKDIWQKNDATSEDIKSLPLSKIFPRPDFPQLVKDGKLPVESALLLRYLYDTIPPKPRKEYKLKTWVSGVKSVIDAMNTLIDNPSYYEQVMRTMGLHSPSSHNAITTYIALHKELGFPETDLNTGKYEVKRFDGRGYSIINGPYIISDHETLAEAAAALKRQIEQNRKKLASGEVKLSIYQDTRTKKYFIGRKGATGIVRLVDNIEKLADAKTMFRDQQVQLQEMWRQLKVKPEERRSSNRERIGVDYRKGKNITPETFSETFGFRGVQFGNWVNNDERQYSLNEAYDALMDLSTTLGISGRALSLNGELGIAFGARGSGKYNAHYEPGQVVINLTKTKGAGSLAHEWWHALDNYFSRMKGDESKYFTESPRQKILNTGEKDQSVRKEMADSFKALVSAINKSGLPERSKNLDKARSAPYWSTIIEMSARSFENYIIEKLAANEGSNDYLANFKEIGEWAERGLNENNYPYPTKDETEVINAAFQDLFDTIQEKVDQDTGNVMLYRSAELDWMDIDGIKRSTTNSEGRPIAQTEEGVRNFWKWFGNSKVVDNEGRPLVVYHGTNAEFNEFRANHGQIMFSPFRKYAQIMAGNGKVYSQKVNLGDVAWINGDEGQLAKADNTITKAEIQDWIDQNRIEVQEVINREERGTPIIKKLNDRGIGVVQVPGKDVFYWISNGFVLSAEEKSKNIDLISELASIRMPVPKYSQYQLPGGSNYKELLLTMPTNHKSYSLIDVKTDKVLQTSNDYEELVDKRNELGGEHVVLENDESKGVTFKSGHFDEPNILAHIRFNERTDSKGNKVLFLEEIQSDWAQEGKKKGFKGDYKNKSLVEPRFDGKYWYLYEKETGEQTSSQSFSSEAEAWKTVESTMRLMDNGVPNMPFRKTDQWVNLALRRMMRYAAENGFDRIAWTNGEQQAERYDLSKQVSQIDYWKSQDEGYTGLTIYDIKGTPIDAYNGQEFKNNEIENIIGKELALKILNDDYTKGEEVRTIKGDSLKVGGFGMKAFYDSIIPKAAKKLGKPFGATIEEVAFPVVAKEAYNETTEELELSPEAEEIQDRFMESQAEEGDYELEDYVQDMKDAGYEVLFENGEPVNLKKITTGQTFTVQSLPVTYAMKETVSAGVPLFRPSNASSIRERIIARDRLESMVDKLNIKVNIVNQKDVKDQKQRNSKGFYNTRTGEITIVLDNHKTADDAIATLLHEAVAHKGLRTLFGADFNRFLDSVYQNAGKEERAEIGKLITKYGWDTRLATEEYLATLAESTNYNESESLWRKIKNFFMDMLRRAGIKMDGVLTDADLRYILQRSYDRLTDPSGPGGVFDAARDAQIRRRVGLNSDNDTRYRSNKNAAQDKVEQFANNAYDARLNDTMNKIREAHQDSMLSLKILQEEVAKASRKEIQTFEDAYLAENHISSKNLYEKEHFMANYYEPMSKAIRSLSDKLDGEYQSVVIYAMAKHGLERNIKLAERDAEKMHAKWKAELDKKLAQELIDQAKYDKEIKRLEAKYDETVAYFRGRDYSGLTALFPASESVEELPDVALAEAMAQELVDQVEEAAPEEVQELWSRVNAATKKSLYKTYETGILTRSVYENIRDMYDYYIPLRGFSETTADDVYEYLQFDRSSFSPPVLTARGRKSMADDPFATIGTMAESAIQQGNNNWMKQKFLNMALNHESDLISVREMWYENKGTEENPDWVQAVPDIAPGANAMEVNQAYETFEQRMADLSGIGMAKKSMKGLNIPYRTLGKQAQEHSVIVKSAGKEYVIFINGNPRAAQAINGLTNPDVSDARKKIMRANRWLAANYTTRSPKFMLRNLSRDTIYSLFNIYVKEDKAYNRRFRANLARGYVSIWKLMRDYSQNKLDATTREGMYMQEFLANGGETGYTVLKRVDEYKRIMSDLMAQAKGGKVITLKKALRYVFDQIGFANRCIEDICRFTAFTTSRQMGRSVEESIADAKNVSVNFNKKGSGQGYGASTLRTAYLFYNAGVQGLDNFVSLYKKNPRKFTIGTASMLAAGALMPFFNQLIAMALGGDPDEYLDMPEWIRRNNMVVGGNGFYITIPLPIELRAIYGIGDIAYMASAGRMKNKNIAGEILGQLTDIMPVDPVGNNTGVANLVPDIVSPLFENLINEDFTGRPIFKNNSFNRYYPAFTKAYAGTNKALVRASELINRIGGGDDVTKGWVENNITIADVNNPAKWEHIFEGYFGGALITANEAAKTLSMIWDPDQRILRNVPLANVLLQHNDERTSNSFINDMYYYYKEEYDKVKQSVTKYGQDPEKYSKQQRSLEDKDRYKRCLVFEEHLDEIKNVEKELKEAPDNEAKRNLNAYYNRLKGRLVDELMKRD